MNHMTELKALLIMFVVGCAVLDLINICNNNLIIMLASIRLNAVILWRMTMSSGLLALGMERRMHRRYLVFNGIYCE